MKLRVPDPCDLALEPQLGPLILLEIAVVLVINALRARHLPIVGDPTSDELDHVTAARRVIFQCHRLLRTIRVYRAPIVDRLACDQAARLDDDQ